MAKILAYDLDLLVNDLTWSYKNLLDCKIYTDWRYKINHIRGKYLVIRCNCPKQYVPVVLKWLRINNVNYDSLSLNPDMPDFQEKPVVAVDMDGTLTQEVCWNEDQCKNAKPSKLIHNLISSKDLFIVLWTARQENLIPASLEWLERHKVPFQAISKKKMAATLYVDDKTVNPVPDKAKRLAKKLLSI